MRHRKFGEGVILNVEGQGAHARVQVNFEQVGTKWLVLAYANRVIVKLKIEEMVFVGERCFIVEID